MSSGITMELNFNETELTLALPGKSRVIGDKWGTKRSFCETVDLKLGFSNNEVRNYDISDSHSQVETKPRSAKGQVVGWPPVRAYRKNAMKSCCKYVKVAVDGAPYLRKVDLEMYSSYPQLLSALEHMFYCFTTGDYLNKRKLMEPINGSEYVPTYEDKDGDWMLVGDVPWIMFVESCQRLRLMRSSEVHNAEATTLSKDSSITSC